MSFRLLFLALVFATISLVCFGDQEKKVVKSSCFGVPLFRGLVKPDFQGIKTENVSPASWNYPAIQCSPCHGQDFSGLWCAL